MFLLKSNNKTPKLLPWSDIFLCLRRWSGVPAFLHPALLPWCHPSSSPRLPLQPLFACSESAFLPGEHPWCWESCACSGFVPLCWVLSVDRGDELELRVSRVQPLLPPRACPPSSPCPGCSGWPCGALPRLPSVSAGPMLFSWRWMVQGVSSLNVWWGRRGGKALNCWAGKC